MWQLPVVSALAPTAGATLSHSCQTAKGEPGLLITLFPREWAARGDTAAGWGFKGAARGCKYHTARGHAWSVVFLRRTLWRAFLASL